MLDQVEVGWRRLATRWFFSHRPSGRLLRVNTTAVELWMRVEAAQVDTVAVFSIIVWGICAYFGEGTSIAFSGNAAARCCQRPTYKTVKPCRWPKNMSAQSSWGSTPPLVVRYWSQLSPRSQPASLDVKSDLESARSRQDRARSQHEDLRFEMTMLDTMVPPKLPISEMEVARTPQVIRLAKMTYDERSPRFLRHLQDLDHPSKRNWTNVERICSEMLATEKDYVSDITALVQRFFDPLAAFADKYIKTKEELPSFTTLRCAAHFILGIHKELLKQMEPTQQRRFFNFSNPLNPTSGPLEAVTRVSKAFASTVEYMKVYALYCSNYLPATEELKTHAKLLDAFTLSQHDINNNDDASVDAVSDLIKPVQRICRYSLLFRSLVQNATTPEEALLSQQALDSIQRVSDQVNARVRDAENNVRLVNINNSIDNAKIATKLELLRPGRTLLCEMPAAVQVMDLRARLARALHLNRTRRKHKRERQQSRDSSASLNSEMELLGGEDSEVNREESALRESLTSNCYERTKDRQRVILLSDALLIANKSNFRLRVRRHICLSCATVIEANDSDGTSGVCTRSFALLASKSGRCNCHNLSPSSLKRPVKRRYSLSKSMSQLAIEEPEHDSMGVACPSSPPHRRLLRTAHQYIVHCESEQKKREFVALLRDAISRCECSEDTPRSCISLTATNLSTKLWQSIKQHDFSQTLSMGYGSLLRRRANAMASVCHNEEVNGSTDESTSDDAPTSHQNQRLLRTSRLATSGAASQSA
ncbi:unnamed protein product [Phytophthora fragariaefolia]|uniref:Unnamed protein product n=1 Tax=Phytophthora fragariaefolia TaxID=1490495 RepID=A0A9W6TUC7_9STRA|nr:unnamed protein product [Phytophthora fragariaefolia]